MKKILVPTDFSKGSEDALKVAAQLAKRYDSELHVMHMIELPFDMVDPMHETSELPEAMFFMKMAHKSFETFLDKDYLEGIDVREAIQNNNAFEGIIDSAHGKDIDLIVMGSRGASGFKEMVIGSNTEKVVRTSDVPVLVIKREDDNFRMKDMVFACEFTEEYKKSFIDAIAFAKTANATMHLLMVNTPSGFMTTMEAEQLMNDFLEGVNIGEYTLNIYNDVSIEKGILNFGNSINADVIAMSTHGRKGLSHFFNGSISEDLVNHAKRPVVTFKI
ncbi:MAG: universal stress protein UspA [Kordia sp.]|nr:MAG: universal stress protein UspA [Kordia sp.]